MQLEIKFHPKRNFGENSKPVIGIKINSKEGKAQSSYGPKVISGKPSCFFGNLHFIGQSHVKESKFLTKC